MSAPFNLALVLLAIFASEDWALCAARYERAPGPHLKRLSLHARTRAVVVHDRLLNGWTE